MDFSFTETQAELRGLASTIVGQEATPDRQKELEAADDWDRRLWAALAEANLVGVSLPERFGGLGFGVMELAVVLAEVGRHVAPVPFVTTIALAAMPLARFGDPQTAERLLPGVVAGTTLLGAALEEAAGFDVLDPATVASREGTGWRIDGEKVAVAYAAEAAAILVSATVGEGETAVFIVEAGTVGLTIEAATGTQHEPQALVSFEGVLVSAEARLGNEAGESGEVLAWIHRHGLAALAATAVGVFEEAIRITAGYLTEREQFGRPLATFQGATLRAADAYIDTRAIAEATWSAVWRLAEGRPADDALAIAKFWVAEGGQRVAHACQHLHGGIGVDTDYPIHRYFLWAKHLELTLGGATIHLIRLGDSFTRAGALVGKQEHP